MARARAAAAVWFAAVLVFASAAWGLINPDFSPVHLVDQSDVIVLAKAKDRGAGDRIELELVETLKGECPKKITIDLTKAPEKHVEMARVVFSETMGQPILVFAGKFEDEEERVAFLHVGGQWLELVGETGKWEFVGIYSQMDCTWDGGTDMLLRCVKYILEDKDDAFVPVDEGTRWRNTVKVGTVGKKATNILAVDLAGTGKLTLHVAAPAGDRLFRYAKDKFEDATAAAKLDAKSQACTWADFDGDGLLDLASFDGKTLTIWTQAAGGTFRAAAASGKFEIPAGCPGLAAIGLVGQSLPAIVVSGEVPAVLKTDGKGGFEPVALTVAKHDDLGKPQACLVADFNGDAVPDILQPFEKNGLLFAGKKDGGFGPGALCGVRATEGGGKAAIGDFNGDGWLDVLVAGAGETKIFQNLHNGRFEDCTNLSGEFSYKAQPAASWVSVGDFNNDCLQDILLTYAEQPILLYYNLGFRSLQNSPRLEMKLNEEIEGIVDGQQMGLFADLDHDGAQDLVLVQPDGTVWCAFNDLGGTGALTITARMAPKAAFPGPVTVKAYQGKRLMGAWQAPASAQPVFLGVRVPGTYFLRWQLPGGPEQEKKVVIETKPVVILDEAK